MPGPKHRCRNPDRPRVGPGEATRLQRLQAEPRRGVASGAKGTAWIHPNHQAVGMLRQERLARPEGFSSPLSDRIGLPVLFPAEAPILVGHIVPNPRREG